LALDCRVGGRGADRVADVALIRSPMLTGADLAALCRDQGTAADIEEIAGQVATGRATAWCGRMLDGGHRRRAGVVVLREERRGVDREMVLVCAAGVAGAFRSFLPHIRTLARRAECATIRAHNRRRGFHRLMRQEGFDVAETVWRRPV